jgi:hypothetical protein
MPWQGGAARAVAELPVRGEVSLELLVHRAARGVRMQCTDQRQLMSRPKQAGL